MFSWSKTFSTVVLMCAALLLTSPLAAARKTRPAATHAKTRSAVSSSKPSAKSKVAKSKDKAAASTEQSSRKSSRKSDRAAAVSVRSGRHSRAKSSYAYAKVSAPARPRGQQAIDSSRTMEIQQALIREHYLDGDPTGEWDQATRDALIRFQNDNHWQTKIVPDSRALIKLGLGPSRQNLLNPETAAMAQPRTLSASEKPVPGGSN